MSPISSKRRLKRNSAVVWRLEPANESTRINYTRVYVYHNAISYVTPFSVDRNGSFNPKSLGAEVIPYYYYSVACAIGIFMGLIGQFITDTTTC